MLLTQIYGLPATNSSLVVSTYSAPGRGCASGGVPGHIAICVCPADGWQTCVCALVSTAHRNRMQTASERALLIVLISVRSLAQHYSMPLLSPVQQNIPFRLRIIIYGAFWSTVQSGDPSEGGADFPNIQWNFAEM
jgi:hypothetical protein